MAEWNMIVCHDAKGGIGKNGKMPWSIPADLKLFKKITTEKRDSIVVMGRKTWESIPIKHRPLPDRINIIFSKNDAPRTADDDPDNVDKKTFFVTSVQQFDKLVEEKFKSSPVFVIGGRTVYDLFKTRVSRIYVTEIDNDFNCDTFFDKKVYDDEAYKKVSTEVISDKDFAVKHLVYEKAMNECKQNKDNMAECKQKMNIEEKEYLDLIQTVLEKGEERKDRTNVGTKSLFCPKQLRFDVTDGKVPLLTTKRVPWKTVIVELLWFLAGKTDAKLLQEQKVRIWDGNSTREFLDKRGLHDYPEGVLGPVYGHQWRHFGAKYDPNLQDQQGGFDQIEYVIDLLKRDPFSRRIIVSAWNPPDLEKSALPPCHNYFQFYVSNDNFLSIHFHMRSVDTFLGLPFNIFSYTVLLYIIAKKVDMKPKEVVATFGDTHLYLNHVEQAKTQLEREPYAFPTIKVDDVVRDLDFSQLKVEHFTVTDYKCHPTIKAPMAV